MMINRRIVRFSRTNFSGLRERHSNLIVKNAGSLGKHGTEINAFFTLPPCRHGYLRVENRTSPEQRQAGLILGLTGLDALAWK